MAAFESTFMDTANWIFQCGAEGPTRWVPLGVCLVATVVVLRKAGDWVDIPNLGWIRATLLTVVGWAILLAAVTAARLLLPNFDNGTKAIFIRVAGGFAGMAVILSPITSLVTRSRWPPALSAWILTVGLSLIAMGVSTVALDAFVAGRRNIEKGIQHNRDTLDFLDR